LEIIFLSRIWKSSTTQAANGSCVELALFGRNPEHYIILPFLMVSSVFFMIFKPPISFYPVAEEDNPERAAIAYQED
jgi:hypothetical protein